MIVSGQTVVPTRHVVAALLLWSYWEMIRPIMPNIPYA